MRHTLSLLPPPTCTHPPTVGPITTPSTTNPPPPPLPPPVTHSRTQTQATHPPVTHSSVAGVGVSLADVGSQTTHITTTTTTDTGIQTSPMMGSRVSVADAYLQTSFTGGADITIPVPTPVEEGSSDVYGEFPRASRHFATTVDIETETSQMDAPETDDSRGISLVGNQAGVSSSGAAVDLSFPTVEERGKKWELSAEEMNKRMSKHLENQVTEWVTRELLTRALAAANQPCDVVESHDENTPLQLDCSPNSCSTCSPSPLTRAHLTSVPQPTDIIGMGNMEGDGDGHTGSEGVRRGGGEGVRVRGDEVEVMVREVIREKVAEALMKQTHSTEESPVDDGGRSNATSYSESTSDTTPLVLTPSPSPPPPHTSPPPSPSSQHDTTSLHSHPQVVATPTATPPLSQRSPSTTVSQSHTFSTPLETEEDTSGVAVEEETFDPKGEASARTGTPLPTPPPSPPHQAPPTLTPPSATRDPTPPPSSHPRPNQPKTFDFSLSESCSSASPSTTLTISTEAHPHHSHTITTTTTNLTTDQEISAGEFTRTRPPPLLGAANSLSEGEVALSPGDAAWYTAYATKIGSLGRPPTTTDHDPLSKTLKVSPIVAAFLDLKNSPESLCDTSDYSESYQSNSYYVTSAGEVRVKPRQCGGKSGGIGGKSGGKSGGGDGDPLERFLASLQSSTPDTSSTPTPPTSGDNTLSDMPSISADNNNNNDDDDERHNNDEPISQGEARGKKGLAPRHLQATGGAMQVAGHSLGLVDNGAPPVVPYHVKFPLEKGEAVSPGEVRGGERVRKDRGKKHNLSVSFVHSEGEVNRVVRGKTEPGKVGDRQQPLSRIALASSPGELRIRTSNETRDGIDVIRVSRSSHNSSYSTSLHTHSSPTPPGVTPRRLRVSSELGPSRVLSVVTPALATNSMAKCSADESGQERAPSSSTPDSREPAVIPRRPAAAPSVDGFPPNEDKESPDSTRPPRLDSLLDTSSSSSSPGVSPPRPLTLSEKSLEQQSIVISGGTAGNRLSEDRVHLNSFWETQTPDITSPFTHRAVQRQQATPVDHTPLASSETRAQGTGGGGKQLSETQVDEKGTVFVPTPSPTRPQHTISIPTGTVEGEPSPTHSPTYSTDFDFSSISQPTFD